MNLKNISILCFLQIVIITICIIAINMGLYFSMDIHKSLELELPKFSSPIPFKVLFYLQVQEKLNFLYTIPINWFLITGIIKRIKFINFNNRFAIVSTIMINIIFIILTVDASFMPQSMIDAYCIKKNFINYRCKDMNHNLWKSIEQYYNK